MSRVYTQSEHEAINSREYPGTRQLCCQCDEPTGRCEDDSMYADDIGPLCEECYPAACQQVNDNRAGGIATQWRNNCES